jgi:hypothetical protein
MKPIKILILTLGFHCSCVPPATAETALPKAVELALTTAGSNRAELEKAIREVPDAQRPGLLFLLEHMPKPDLENLKADFLLENTALAYAAWEAAPWKAQVPTELFLNDVLPYANISEPRENWRKKLRELSLPLIKEAKTPGEAGQMLNQKLFPLTKVKYSTKRRAADQGPLESMETGMATCTGLSILLIDACRAVGVPARFAGTPLWVNKSGNHSWVEIWDNGDWHFVGAAEPDAAGMNRGWFTGIAAQAIKDEPLHAIYAASFKKTGLVFPNGWSRNAAEVHAVNVTDRYTAKAKPMDASLGLLKVRVVDSAKGGRVVAKVKVTDAEDDKVQKEGSSKPDTADMNDHLEFRLPKGRKYAVETQHGDKVVRRTVLLEEGKETLVTIDLNAPSEPDKPTASVTPGKIPVDEKEIARYTAFKVAQPITIDGKLDEEAWGRAPASPRFVDLISGKKTMHDTHAHVLWDDSYLYVAYRVQEPFLKAKYTKTNDPIYYDNDVELFVAGRDAYYELELNAFNTTYEAFFIWDDGYEKGGFSVVPEFSKSRMKPFNGVGFTTHPRGGRQGSFEWFFPGKKTAVFMDGTLNDDKDRDRGWTVEVALPWKGMEWLAKADGRALPPKEGDVWRMDFSRFNTYKEPAPAKDSGGWAWSYHGVWDSHIPECFPFITFSKEDVMKQTCTPKP